MRVLSLVALGLVACNIDQGFEELDPDAQGDDTGCVSSDEVCDDVDNDCDGAVDEDVLQDFYADGDDDGFGAGDGVQACTQPPGHTATAGDCDDDDAGVHPGADELCDDADQDCDELIDETLPLDTWYADVDGDGWGNPDAPVEDCAQPDGTTKQLADCDDDDDSRHLCRSCQEILDVGWSTGDGDYDIASQGCGEITVFCDMTTDGGGWTEALRFDAATDACPGDWQSADTGASLVCTRDTSDTWGTRTALFPTCVLWDEVLGNATLLQYGSTDAFGDTPHPDIDGPYGDVVSLTHGSPREHLFTYTFGFLSGGTDDSNCPAIGGAPAPALVGSDYLCDTGNASSTSNQRIWYTTPLFADDWWQVTASSETLDDVEVRLMATHGSSDEDVATETLILRVR
jgi:hypothetical protein